MTIADRLKAAGYRTALFGKEPVRNSVCGAYHEEC
jgi:arylsulfatase A-like enzyme